MHDEQPPFGPEARLRVGEDPMRLAVSEAALDIYLAIRHHQRHARRHEAGSMWRLYWKTRERQAYKEFEALVEEYERLYGEGVPFDYGLAEDMFGVLGWDVENV